MRSHYVRVTTHLLPAAVLAVIGMLGGCASAPRPVAPPEVSLAALHLLDTGDTAQRFRVYLQVTNPNDVRVPIERLSFAVRIAGGGMMRGAADTRFVLAPGESRDVDVEIATNLVSSVSRLAGLVQGPSSAVPYDLDGLVTLSRRVNPTHPFSERGEVPLTLPTAAP